MLKTTLAPEPTFEASVHNACCLAPRSAKVLVMKEKEHLTR